MLNVKRVSKDTSIIWVYSGGVIMKGVPNLTCNKTLDYTIYLRNHEAKNDDQFDFIQVETCKHFPMLVTSTDIR